MIKTGDELLVPPGTTRRRVVRDLGEGGQGRVFEVSDDVHEALAVKWYFAHTATRTQRQSIELLVEQGPPSDRFLWPIGLVEDPRFQGFGYSMPLRLEHHAGLHELLSGKVELGFGATIDLCTELAHSFLLLHTRGLCYRDISFGNVFFDPITGRPLICDNDNVGVDGNSPTAVLGTRRFMAPEIVRGEASPSTRTDLYSLAVLLFYILMVGHPLVGRRELAFECWDDRAESELFGRRPLFIFDPIDRSNAPLDEQHGPVADNWAMFPQSLRAKFVQAFTEGLANPQRRVGESMWRRELARLRDTVGQCSRCGKENIFVGDHARSCWFCARPLDDPMRLVFADGRSVILSENTRIMPHHVADTYEFHRSIAAVARHPSRPDVWGLRNTGPTAWTATAPDNVPIEVTPGRSITLVPGLRIDFTASVWGRLEL